MKKSLDKQVVLITGVSRGIGRAIALVLGHAGAIIIGTATSANGASLISDALRAEGIVGRGVVLNVNNSLAAHSLIDEILKEYKALNILVNNAGITQDQLAIRMRNDEWDAVINTNLKAVFHLSRAVLRPMIKARSGRIINITSIVGSTGNSGQVNYAAAKAGVAGMTRALAREIGSRNITVNCVAPGFIDTDMTRLLSMEQRSALDAQIPLGRLGIPEDVAHAVAFLASAQAGYITGTTLHVNGGMYMC
ncbi:3-oxoacyl-ACP reductase FabG [Candidatus Vallotia cooleyia]|uniref:3-oxoacyl-ACP reductase FabG n=1 Tax=Candidatus Vallotiella adelgis TaxID=1177211 RepID=UPI001D01A8AD|nr:3-oxoacyl-ACP reductase FabG [Candidatus Vallotia cooleyia]UDG82043.1 3-oxoacyl-[acyl-carrier-protein] reductase FabG [Candidatus Vallotia cooleyia]